MNLVEQHRFALFSETILATWGNSTIAIDCRFPFDRANERSQRWYSAQEYLTLSHSLQSWAKIIHEKGKTDVDTSPTDRPTDQQTQSSIEARLDIDVVILCNASSNQCDEAQRRPDLMWTPYVIKMKEKGRDLVMWLGNNFILVFVSFFVHVHVLKWYVSVHVGV